MDKAEEQELSSSESTPSRDGITDADSAAIAKHISEWLRSYLVNLLEIPPGEIDDTHSFDRYGLDSAAAVSMTGELGEYLGCDIDAASPYDYPTIRRLSDALSVSREVRDAALLRRFSSAPSDAQS